jgi:hypothetical protein
MKTERRHELQTNILADWLGKQIEAIRPYWQIIAGVLIGAIVIVIVIVVMSTPAQQDSGPWTSLFIASTPEELENVVIQNTGQPPAWWAKLERADLRLEAGLRYLRDDKPRARSLLDEALNDYLEVAEKADAPSQVHRAHWGAAKVHESLAAALPDDNDLKKHQAKNLIEAAEQYRILVEKAKDADGEPNGFGREAKRCLERLVNDEGKLRTSITGMYYELATYKPLDRSSQFLTEADLIDVPDLSFPGEESAVLPPTITPPSTDPPSTDAPSTDTPSTDAPSTDTPSTDTPSTNTPATETPSTGPPTTEPSTPDPSKTDPPQTDPPSTDRPSAPAPSESDKPEGNTSRDDKPGEPKPED